MVRTTLINARTYDGLTLPGVIFEPSRGRTVLVWVPGLGGPFTSHLKRTNMLAQVLARHGIALAVFNTRGSYTVAHLKVGVARRIITAGEAFEHFTDCKYDIAAMVRTVKALGYRKVVLAGHSTGANKVAYYCSRPGHGVAAAIMLGPVSDIPGLRQQYGKKFNTVLARARTMVQQGRGGELLPSSLVGSWFWSAARLLSVATPGKPEDTFPYYDSNRKFPWVKNWRLPLLVILGSRDQFLDRPARDILNAFDKQCKPIKQYRFELISGADHSFTRHGRELSRVLVSWVRQHTY